MFILIINNIYYQIVKKVVMNTYLFGNKGS